MRFNQISSISNAFQPFFNIYTFFIFIRYFFTKANIIWEIIPIFAVLLINLKIKVQWI